jgi:AraC-like DNA-binding protein
VGALYSLALGDDWSLKLDQIQSIHLPSLFRSSDIKALNLIEMARINPGAACDQLDILLRSLFQQAKEDKHSELVRKTLPLLAYTPISALGDKLHCSQRTLERSFNRVTGLTLKQCQAINKLEELLEYLYQRDDKDIDWVEIAFKFGFSDQPHLIRHLKKQLGLTPQNYANERGFTIDVYGGVTS